LPLAPLFAFYLPLGRDPVPVDVTGLRTVGEVARAVVRELALPAKLGRAVTAADVRLFVISREAALRLVAGGTRDALPETGKAAPLGSALDAFDATELCEGSCLLLELNKRNPDVAGASLKAVEPAPTCSVMPPLSALRSTSPAPSALIISSISAVTNTSMVPTSVPKLLVKDIVHCNTLLRVEWAVFMHTNPVNEWRRIVDDEVETIRSSPLYKCGAFSNGKIHYGFQRGTPWPFSDDAAFVPYKEAASMANIPNIEQTTLQPLYEWCSLRPHALVAYIHDKGTRISETVNPERFKRLWDWRRLHEYFILEQPEGCFRHLLDDNFDACGANKELSPWPHFSGNFWWARCSYINQLEPPATYRADHPDAPERWIGSLPQARLYECYNSHANPNHYEILYPRSIYNGRDCS
jgi:hypothetical protein